MRLIKFIIVIIILSQVLSNGKALPALAAGFSAVTPVITQAWQKQTVIDKDTINKSVIGPARVRMVAFGLPKIKRVVNIDKIVEDLHRLRNKVEMNI